MSASTPATAPVLTLVNGVPTTTSLDVAAFFGKRHDAVLRDIRNVAAQVPADHAHNFVDMVIDISIGSGATRKTPAIRLSKTGFTLLAMGFTGAKAMAFKLAYIDAFDRMERELTARALLTPSATAAELSSARNRRAHDLAVAYEATLRAAIRRDEPPTLDAIMAWQPADAAPTPAQIAADVKALLYGPECTYLGVPVSPMSKEEGGRHTPFFNNYRPQFYFRTTDVTGVVTLPAGTEMVMPGDNISFDVELITPIAMEEKLRFAIREGGRTVGAGVVSKIIE